MSRDLASRVADRLNGGADALMDRALELRGSPSRGPGSWAADRFGLLKRLAFAPWKVRRRARPLQSDVVVFDVGLDETYRRYRSEFVARHFGEEADFVSAATPRTSGRGTGAWWTWYLFGLRVAARAAVDLSARRYFWLGQMLLEAQALALAAPGIRKAYVFRLFDRRPYLAATFLARHTGAEVRCVFQNIPLWRNCRYFHVNVPVVLTSLVNLPEVTWLQAQGFFRTPAVTYRSQEFVGAMPEPSEPCFDVGFISSGEWARRDGLYQVADVESIRRGDHAVNEYAARASWLVETLAEYTAARGLTLRIYPHPYERRLLREHGIEPPWMRLVDGEAITYADAGTDSRATIYEQRVAVSLQSSYIWERLDLGLTRSFIYDFRDDGMNAFKREALGAYQANVFWDESTLLDRLDHALGPGSRE